MGLQLAEGQTWRTRDGGTVTLELQSSNPGDRFPWYAVTSTARGYSVTREGTFHPTGERDTPYDLIELIGSPDAKIPGVVTEAPREKATRHNAGKIDYTLIPVDALEAEARVWAAGEGKYGRGNWERLWGGQTVQVVMASLLRHAMAIQSGETTDPETGEYHAAHIRCNAAMLIRHANQLHTEQPVTANTSTSGVTI